MAAPILGLPPLLGDEEQLAGNDLHHSTCSQLLFPEAVSCSFLGAPLNRRSLNSVAQLCVFSYGALFVASFLLRLLFLGASRSCHSAAELCPFILQAQLCAPLLDFLLLLFDEKQLAGNDLRHSSRSLLFLLLGVPLFRARFGTPFLQGAAQRSSPPGHLLLGARHQPLLSSRAHLAILFSRAQLCNLLTPVL